MPRRPRIHIAGVPLHIVQRGHLIGVPVGLANAVFSPHPLYLALGAADDARGKVYRELFRTAVVDDPLSDLRTALNQDQPIGNTRFYAEIEAMTGQRRELKKRGRP